ncbi:MAG: ABC transporter ATP-binding protein, partial [Candidatus Electrothrix sp. AUS4]|nr:ABC transporter ATP-binding protein [Candidatus Electrothrix sp. AUS4]
MLEIYMILRDSELVKNIIILWRYLGERRRAQFFILSLLMLVSIFAEVITIGAVIPFLGVLTAPEQIFTLSWLQPVIQTLHIETAKELLLPLTLLFILVALFSSGVRIAQLWY